LFIFLIYSETWWCVAPSEKRQVSVKRHVRYANRQIWMLHLCYRTQFMECLNDIEVSTKRRRCIGARYIIRRPRQFLAPNFQLLTRIIWDVCFARWRGLCRWWYIGLGMAREACNRQTQKFNNLPCSFRTISGVTRQWKRVRSALVRFQFWYNFFARWWTPLRQLIYNSTKRVKVAIMPLKHKRLESVYIA
jgi:hypothetical protein